MASPLTLTIGGVNFLPAYMSGSAEITSQLKNQGDSMRLRLAIKTGGTLPTTGQEVIFKDSTRFLFGGFLTRLTPTEYGIGQLIEYDVEVSDYTYLLTNKLAQSSYTNQTLGYIVNDLLSNYMAAGYNVTHVNTATGPTITSVSFNHISLRQCFEKLAKFTNYIWWIDYQKDIHFIDPTNAVPCAEKVTDSSSNIISMAINGDVSQVRNQIIIQGGVSESSSFQEVKFGDASTRGWVLTYTVFTMATIELDTGGGYVSKVIGQEGRDDETSCYFMYDPSRGSFRMASGSATPGASDKIRITYTYPLDILTQVQDATSVTLMKVIEGGDGIHSYVITDSTLTTLDAAKKRGLQELGLFSLPFLQGEFVTRTGLLQAGTYFTVGQALTVNLPSWGISTDTVYVVQKVTTTLVETGGTIEYGYKVDFGGRMIGVSDFLLALATPEQPTDTSVSVQKIFGVSEPLTIAETITRNRNARSVAETLTIAESVSKSNFTPPFQWQPSANPAKWGKAEWA